MADEHAFVPLQAELLIRIRPRNLQLMTRS